MSRCESVRVRLSRAAWEDGLGTYFRHSVPFSASTGRELAAGLVDLLRFVSHGVEPSGARLPVLEIGAGMGMLSRQFLDLLRVEYPDLYDRVDVYVTDASDTMLQQIDALGVLQAHRGRVRLAQLDLARPTGGDMPAPVLVYLACVLDSLPVRHIEVREGRVYELLVRTSIAADAWLLDTSTFPPTILDADHIKQLLLGKRNGHRRRVLSKALVPLLREEFIPVPLGECGLRLSPGERRELETLCEAQVDSGVTVRFNYSSEGAGGIRHLLQRVAPESAVVVHDVGFSRPSELSPETLTVSYGGTSWHPLCFDHLAAAGKAMADHVAGEAVSDGRARTMAFYRGGRVPGFERAFATAFTGSGTTAVDRAIEAISGYAGPSEDFGAHAERVLGSLNSAQSRNYTLRLIAAWEYLARDQLDSAIEWVRRSLESYGEVAADSYLILAAALRQRGELDRAEEAARRALAICPHYGPALAELSITLGRSNRVGAALAAAEASVIGAVGDPVWEQVVSVAIGLIREGEIGRAWEIVRSVARAAREHPERVPDFVVRKLGAVVKALRAMAPSSGTL